MHSPYSGLMPFFAFVKILALVGLALSCLVMLIDFIVMRRRHRAFHVSLWYQRPLIRESLKTIGGSFLLLLMVEAIEVSVVVHLPLTIPASIVAGMAFGAFGVAMMIDLRQARRVQRGEPRVMWFRRPKTVRYLGLMAFWLGVFLLSGATMYDQVFKPAEHAFPWDTILGLYGAPMLGFAAVVLYVTANLLQRRQGR